MSENCISSVNIEYYTSHIDYRYFRDAFSSFWHLAVPDLHLLLLYVYIKKVLHVWVPQKTVTHNWFKTTL